MALTFKEILSVNSEATPGHYLVRVKVSSPEHGDEEMDYVYNPDDPFGLSTDVGVALIDWMEAGKEVSPYVPSEPVPEEPYYPPLTPRQFWLAGYEVGVTEEGLVASVQNPGDPLFIADEAERTEALISIRKATQYDRDHPLVNLLSRGINPDQLDTLWLWASQIK